MQFRPMTCEDLFGIHAQGHQRNLVAAHLTPDYAHILIESGVAYAALQGERVLACGGIVHQFMGVGTMWALLGEGSQCHLLAFHRAMERLLNAAKLRRIESTSEVDFPHGCRWLELLGFQSEGVMRSYGPDGKDHVRYARIFAEPAKPIRHLN